MRLLFVLALACSLLLKLWLSRRQIRYVDAHAHSVPAAFAGRIAREDHLRAARYTIARQKFGVVDTLLGAFTFLVLTWGGGLQWLYRALAHAIGGGFAFDLLFVVAVFGLLALLDVPLEWVRRFRIEQRFGFNRMTQGLFAMDCLKAAFVASILGVPLLALVLWLMRAGGPYWWIEAWAAWAVFSLALGLVYPWLIAPLFNRFTPLADASLRQRIAALLERTGFRSNGVFTMDGSRRSTHGNAYFTGMGAAKRIVFFDTLVERLRPEEIEAVLAHELGHFRRHHIAKQIAIGLVLALGWMALLAWLRDQAEFARALGLSVQPDIPNNGLTLVLFALGAPLFSYFFSPLRSAFSRRHEFEADEFAARHASAQDLVRALVKLYQDNAATLTPDPLHSAFYDSHPPASIRIDRLLAIAPPVPVP
jgi:STE24 endopeptidase